jgi:hypothetical protein
MEQRVKTPLGKLVLLILADCHNGSTNLCFPSLTFLCNRSNCSRQGVINVLIELEREGLISALKTPGKKTYYTLRTGQESVPVKRVDPSTEFISTGQLSSKTGQLCRLESGKNQEVNREVRERAPETKAQQIQEFDYMARSRFVPTDFEPDESWYSTHRHRNPAANYHVELERFKAHEFQMPKSDWQRAWISWWMRAKPDDTHDTRNSLERQTDELLGIDRRHI